MPLTAMNRDGPAAAERWLIRENRHGIPLLARAIVRSLRGKG